MNEKIIQSIVSDLGGTIAQLHIDLASERATCKDLVSQIEALQNEIAMMNETKKEVSNVE